MRSMFYIAHVCALIIFLLKPLYDIRGFGFALVWGFSPIKNCQSELRRELVRRRNDSRHEQLETIEQELRHVVCEK